MSIDYCIIPWDSLLLNKNIIEITGLNDISDREFIEFENEMIKKRLPYMVFVKINARETDKIHLVEKCGYNYIETQFHISKKITGKYDIKMDLKYDKANAMDLPQILDIARASFDTDRYAIDPYIGKTISGQRYSNWISSSYNSEGHLLYKYMIDSEIVGFNLTKVEGKKAFGLLGAVKPEYKGTGIGLYLALILNNILYDSGVKHLETHISAINTDIFNIDMYMQYQVRDVKVVLRKIYE